MSHTVEFYALEACEIYGIIEYYMLCTKCTKEVCYRVYDGYEGAAYDKECEDGEAFKKEECPGAPGCGAKAEEAEE